MKNGRWMGRVKATLNIRMEALDRNGRRFSLTWIMSILFRGQNQFAIALVLMLCSLVSCTNNNGGSKELSQRDSFIQYVDSLIDNEGIVFEGKEIHVQVPIDTLNPGNDEKWNLLNTKLAIQLSTDPYWGKWLIDSTFFLVVRRADNFSTPTMLFVQQFAMHDFILMRDSIHNPIRTVKRIDFLTTNISADEYHQTWLMLHEFRNDSVFRSTDTLFSAVFLGCECGMEKQCADFEELHNIAKRVVADTALPSYVKLDQHLEALNSVK